MRRRDERARVKRRWKKQERFHNPHIFSLLPPRSLAQDIVHKMPFHPINQQMQGGPLNDNDRNAYREAQEMGFVQSGPQQSTTSNIVGVLPWDPTPIKLELREDPDYTEQDDPENLYPELKRYNEERKALEEWEEERKEALNAGIKEETLPDHVQKALAMERAEENLEDDPMAPPGVEKGPLSGSYQAPPSKRVSFF